MGACLIVSCGAPPSSAPPSSAGASPPSSTVAPPDPVATPAPTPPTTAPAPPTTTVDPVDAAVVVDPDAITSTPDGMLGPPIRLASTRAIGTRPAAHGALPRVELDDPAAQAALDAFQDGLAYARCRVELAIEELVAESCAYTDENGLTSTQAELFVIHGAEVTRLDPIDLFLEGATPHTLLPRLQYDPSGATIPFVVSPTGIEIRYEDGIVRRPWRSLASLLRADTPLGAALTTAGLVLAPPGTLLPEPPPLGAASWGTDPATLLARAERLPPSLREVVRFVDPGGQRFRCALVLPPGVEAPPDFTRTAFYEEPMSSFVLTRARSEAVLHESAGPRTDTVAARPAGTYFVTLVGSLDRTVSALGHGGWAYVVLPGGGGWVPARTLERADPSTTCPLFEERDGTTERGIVTDGAATYVWSLTGSHVVVQDLADCTLGATRWDGATAVQVTDLVILPASAETGAPLLFVEVGRDLAVHDLAHPELLLTHSDDFETYRAPVPRRAGVGPFPLGITANGTETVYAWSNGALAPLP